jgi:hypothetical protein
MSMPGFTGEISVYHRGGHYRTAETQRYANGKQLVISQLLAVGGVGGIGSPGLTIDPEQCVLRCQWVCTRYICYPTNCYWLCF